MAISTENSADLLDYKRNVFSQNGEDGIIEELFRRIGVEAHTCCEFGAWDGQHLSNCRKLILEGWRALMIEADPERTKALVQTYRDNPAVACVNELVDADQHSLGAIVKRTGFPAVMDFLSVDIDGLDYEIFRGLDLRPRVICIEVNAAHRPDSAEELPRPVAASGVGQPMGVFLRIAREKGYDLAGYSGNAFLVRRDVVEKSGLKTVSPTDAYDSFLRHLTSAEKEWLYLTNAGLIQPYRRYQNRRLGFQALGLGAARWLPVYWLAAKKFAAHLRGYLQSRFSRGAGSKP
jgi:hypothetical protein